MKPAKKIVLGASVSAIVYLALLSAASLLVAKGRVGESYMGACVWLCAFASAALGAAAGGRGGKRTEALGAAAAFWCVVLVLGAMIYGTPDAMRAGELTLAVLAGGATCLFRRGGTKKKKRRRQRK